MRDVPGRGHGSAGKVSSVQSDRRDISKDDEGTFPPEKSRHVESSYAAVSLGYKYLFSI